MRAGSLLYGGEPEPGSPAATPRPKAQESRAHNQQETSFGCGSGQGSLRGAVAAFQRGGRGDYAPIPALFIESKDPAALDPAVTSFRLSMLGKSLRLMRGRGR